LTLQNDSRKAVELGSNGRRFAEAFLSRDECIRQYEELFRDAIEKRGKTATSVSVKAFESPIVRAARSNDIEAIVDVHLSAFNAGFNLSAFGPRFLRKYYRLILEFEQRVLLVVECDGKIVGFAAGFVNPKGFYAKLKKNKWRLAFAAATAIPGRPSVVVRLLHVARRGSQFMARSETQQENTCELSSIAVRPEASGKGLGKALLNDFVEAAKSGRAREIYLTTDATENESVNAFYRRAGFILACEFMAPRNRQMNEFVLPLDRDACEA
jgi:ribosomal protein S18 acetylase RimI-like enzyme